MLTAFPAILAPACHRTGNRKSKSKSKSASKSAPPRSSPPKKGRPRYGSAEPSKVKLGERSRQAFIDRLDAARKRGLLPIDGELYRDILEAIFPEEFLNDLPLGDPTDTPPRSEARILVYIERARRGQALYHPLDAKPDACRSLALESRDRYDHVTFADLWADRVSPAIHADCDGDADIELEAAADRWAAEHSAGDVEGA